MIWFLPLITQTSPVEVIQATSTWTRIILTRTVIALWQRRARRVLTREQPGVNHRNGRERRGEQEGRVEDTGYSPASSLHVNTQQSRHTADRERAPSQGNKGTHGSCKRHQMNKWFIEISYYSRIHVLLHLSCPHLKGKSDCTIRKSICSVGFCFHTML